MADAPAFEFARIPHPGLVPGETRAEACADPGFGKMFTDHMVSIEWAEGRGWHGATIGPRGPLSLDPAAAVLHYAQEIFEGLKAYRLADGSLALFRPEENARRFNASARRLAMPEIPRTRSSRPCARWCWPTRTGSRRSTGGSLYLRPFMFADEPFLGVRPAKHYKFLVICSPAGNYFKVGRAGGVDLGVGGLHPRGAGRHRGGEVRRQLCREPGAASQRDRARARPGGVPRRGRAPLGRGASAG